jgi:hypothetical protein
MKDKKFLTDFSLRDFIFTYGFVITGAGDCLFLNYRQQFLT